MAATPLTPCSVTLAPVVAADLDRLVALRIAAMRESLETIGRFDPKRARERFSETFSPAATRHIVVDDNEVGFIAVRTDGKFRDEWLLDHLYIQPSAQGAGIGSAVLAELFAKADAAHRPIRVGALRGSDSNRFYQRHGFQLVDSAEFDHFYVRPAGAPSVTSS